MSKKSKLLKPIKQIEPVSPTSHLVNVYDLTAHMNGKPIIIANSIKLKDVDHYWQQYESDKANGMIWKYLQ